MSRLHAFVHFQEVRNEGVVRIGHTLRLQRGFVQRFSFAVVPPLIALAIATTASAATVVSFVAVKGGDTLIVSNQQGNTVTGEIRLVPDAGTAAMPPRAFSLPSQGSQAFPNVLSVFGTINSPAIIAVESSDAVTLSSSPLRIAYPERHLTLPVRFNPGTPGTGSLILGILSGLVRVSIYEHPTSVTPLVTRTFGSSGEQVTRLRYADLLPATLRITDGYAAVMPLDGQVVGTAVNPPIRRRSAGTGPTSPPVLSVTGGPACEFATGVRASAPPAAGATYRWTLLNATTQGSLTGSVLDVALGSQGYASLALERTVNGSVTSVEASIRIEGKPVYTSSGAPSVTLGQDATIEWALGGSTPTSQTISGTDFPTASLDASATSYTYRPTTEGNKSYALSADNACGGSGASGDYSVFAACTSPHIDSFTSSGAVCAGNSAQLTWSTSGSGTVTISNGVGTVPASGSVAVSPSATTVYTITKTASCGSNSGTTTVTVTPAPTISSFTIDQNVICPGAGSTMRFTIANAISWSVRGSLENGNTPSDGTGSGSFTSSYGADNQAGDDIVTLTVLGACGTTATRTLNVTVPSYPVITSFTAPATVAPGMSGTINFAYTNGTSYAFTSSLGNTFTPSGGNSTTGGSVTYSRDVAAGPDTITLLVTAPGPCQLGAAQQRVINDPPAITNFTAPSTLEWATSGPVSFTLQNTESWTITTSSTTNGWDSFDPGDANYFSDPSQGPQGAQSWTGASTCSPNTNCTPNVSGSITLTFSPYLPNNDAIILTAVGPGGTATRSVQVKIPGGICKAVDIASVVPLGGSTTLKVKWLTSDAGTLTPSSSLGNAFTPANQPTPEGLGTYSFLYTRSVAGDDQVRLTGPGCEVQAIIK